ARASRSASSAKATSSTSAFAPSTATTSSSSTRGIGMSKAFASQADTEDKKIPFSRLSEHAYAFTAESDPNTGIVVGDDSVMVIDAQATPVMAQTVIEKIR